ncbi:hypothetical protein ABZ671_18415 [Micromonospora sp. NPDC006766]|uniref:hypothetical protein n=1 Tax=Micromonospora sp. NPDC006766 TaxID=3154778 RepID=UPI0034074385
MYVKAVAWDRVKDRGPRWAVYGQLRPQEARTEYADTAERAEKIREDFEEKGYYQVQVHPPVGSVDLAKLGRERTDAKRVLDEKTAILRAGVLRALEEGRAEAEVARTAGVDRQTVRKWAGKD